MPVWLLILLGTTAERALKSPVGMTGSPAAGHESTGHCGRSYELLVPYRLLLSTTLRYCQAPWSITVLFR